MKPSIAAIPTVFDGIEYRSRLEAKWASFFRRIGWEFTYEPFDGHGYIPDFVIHGESPFVVEVKPAVTWEQYGEPIPKVTQGLDGVWDGDILIVGVSPFPRGFLSQWEGYWAAGLLGERSEGSCHRDHVRSDPADPFSEVCEHSRKMEWYFEKAPWVGCCGVSVTHEYGSYAGRPCGCYSGSWGPPVSKEDLEVLWAEATNEVKWRGSPR